MRSSGLGATLSAFGGLRASRPATVEPANGLSPCGWCAALLASSFGRGLTLGTADTPTGNQKNGHDSSSHCVRASPGRPGIDFPKYLMNRGTGFVPWRHVAVITGIFSSP